MIDMLTNMALALWLFFTQPPILYTALGLAIGAAIVATREALR